METTYVNISILKFQEVKENLPTFVLENWNKQEFLGFHKGVVVETENYKYDIRRTCLGIFDADN
jgi:hypothetical protein